MPKLQLGRYYRVVVTGDRFWPNEGWGAIKERFSYLPENTLVITSDAQGVPSQADLCGTVFRLRTKTVKTDLRYGKKAIAVRNLRMLEEFKPHLLLSFTKSSTPESREVKHIIKAAQKRKIEIEEISLIRKP